MILEGKFALSHRQWSMGAPLAPYGLISAWGRWMNSAHVGTRTILGGAVKRRRKMFGGL
jgi:hypothetical protein